MLPSIRELRIERESRKKLKLHFFSFSLSPEFENFRFRPDIHKTETIVCPPHRDAEKREREEKYH